ncbi:helix-turn-helix domain-containing protein [Hymenobacter bucti]|uniref:Helix-turn-helix domain-containing protein n=1 Tax=Hymenobacter bucti TaxID=1844114 RepID=A0ABW4QRZ9_9BACT
MPTIHFAPHPALLEFVNSVFVFDIDFGAGTGLSPIYPFVPSPNRFLCFFLRDQVKLSKGPGEKFIERARSIIIGPQRLPVTLDLGQEHQAVVVCLKPAGMYRLLGIPMAELVDCDYDARLVMGQEIDELVDGLQEARTHQQRNDITQRYLLGKLPKLKALLPFDRAMLHQVQASGSLPIERVAAQACLSLRQFERKSYERLGLSPKMYSRMIRFSHAYKYKESAPHTSWLDIAHRCGYYDQMHFIRDFKFFAGFAPSGLREEQIEHLVRFRTMEDLTVAL